MKPMTTEITIAVYLTICVLLNYVVKLVITSFVKYLIFGDYICVTENQAIPQQPAEIIGSK